MNLYITHVTIVGRGGGGGGGTQLSMKMIKSFAPATATFSLFPIKVLLDKICFIG